LFRSAGIAAVAAFFAIFMLAKPALAASTVLAHHSEAGQNNSNRQNNFPNVSGNYA